MSTVLAFPSESVDLKNYRKEFRLSLSQAACALRGALEIDINSFTIEGWENGKNPIISPEEAYSIYGEYKNNLVKSREKGENTLFGSLPIRSARDILGVTIPEIAKSLGYSPSYWAKIEANSRIAPDLVIQALELRLKDRFVAFCES